LEELDGLTPEEKYVPAPTSLNFLQWLFMHFTSKIFTSYSLDTIQLF